MKVSTSASTIFERILFVEDDFLIALQTEAALTEAGFHVVGTATTAEESLALAREERCCIAGKLDVAPKRAAV
jgi:DNA-binding response OmpR family regulator